MTREEKKEELVSLFAVGAIFIGDLIDECFEFGQQHPHWISVEDELPGKNIQVLCHGYDRRCKLGKGYIFTSSRVDKTNYYRRDGNCFIVNGVPSAFSRVTHWMPMPAPPEHFSDASKKKTACPDCIVAQYPSCDKMIPCCQCHDEACNSRQSCPKKGGEE